MRTENNSQLTLRRQKRIRIALVTCLILVLIPLMSVAIGTAGFSIWASTQSVDISRLPTSTAMPTYYDSDGNQLPAVQSDFVESSA
ncbi:MAG: hypothetical protein K2M36_02260, partial [Clostridia bacterium]|nr:hypothetical protein [Clostridia bacterium]